MSNCALVRTLVLRFVIPYASTEVNSYAMMLHPTCGGLFSVSYVQCLFMIIFVFWLVASQFYLLAFHCTKREYCLCIQILNQVVPNESTIPTYMHYFHAIPSKFVCANSNFQNELPSCVPVPLMKRQGVANIFSC